MLPAARHGWRHTQALLQLFQRNLRAPMATATLFDNGVVRVEALAGKGYGLVASRPLPAKTQIFVEEPLVRVNKDTSGHATKLHPLAGPKMQRVYEIASQGGFDPADFGQ